MRHDDSNYAANLDRDGDDHYLNRNANLDAELDFIPLDTAILDELASRLGVPASLLDDPSGSNYAAAKLANDCFRGPEK